MNIRDGEESGDLRLDLTPMIDVVFLLLIFFMVATTFLDPERAIDVDLPVAESGAEPERAPEEVVVTVRQDGSIVLGEHAVTFEELVATLKAAAQHDPKTPVTIRGARLATHGSVVHVMDACGLAGLSNLSVGTVREEG